MQTSEFLDKVTPAQGLKCIAIQRTKGFQHVFCETADAAAKVAAALDKRGLTIYHACASFRTGDSRKGENAMFARSLWLDIDCGAGKPYPTQRDGLRALLTFVKATSLPTPLIVSSGNGLHVYWLLQQDVTIEQWRVAAVQLKQLTELAGLQADPVRTADVASVLRPVGTNHRKTGIEKPVRVLQDSNAISLLTLTKLMGNSINTYGVEVNHPKQRVNNLNADLGVDREFEASSASQIAESCNQLRYIRDTRGLVAEPLWYAGLGVLRFTTEMPAVAHEWSQGHPDYSEDGTDVKLEQHERGGMGPTTCAHFKQINPDGCVGCPHKITSPITLGRAKPIPIVALPITDRGEELPPLPRGYQRTDKGLAVLTADEEGSQSWQVFCDYDMYPVCRMRKDDEEVATLRIKFPKDGWENHDITMSSISKGGKDLAGELGKCGILPNNGLHMKFLPGYLVKSVAALQTEHKRRSTYMQLGWQDNMRSFISGTTRYRDDGTSDQIILDHSAVKPTEGFYVTGELEEWKQVAAAYSGRDSEQFQFIMGASFGSPLMSFMGELCPSALVHMASPEGGEGKSTAQDVALSVYGDPTQLRLKSGKEGDTSLVFCGRLGRYNSLPAVLDEMTNCENDKLSELVYNITQGRERRRMKSDGTEREAQASWRNIVIGSSNLSIVSKLGAMRVNSEAQLMRVFEYRAHKRAPLNQEQARSLFPKMYKNFGVAGAVYLQWLVSHRAEAENTVRVIQRTLEQRAMISQKERFWSATATCALAGVALAKHVGLVDYNVDRLMQWTVDRICDMRQGVGDTVVSPLAAFGAFLNESANNIIIVNKAADMRRGEVSQILNGSTVRTPFVARIEQANKVMFLAKREVTKWCSTNGADVNELFRALQEAGAVTKSGTKKALGHGTMYTTMDVPCWEIDLNSPAISGIVDLAVVATADMQKAVA